MTAPLILGAGPAGCAAAIHLGRAGISATLIDRDAEVADQLCGGFMSWRTAQSLAPLGLDLAALGAHRVDRLRLFSHDDMAEAFLPGPAFGLSRKAFDTAMRERAVSAGAQLRIDQARNIEPGVVEGEQQDWRYTSLFLASGKHDVRGALRPRSASDPSLGLRLRLPPSARLDGLIGDAIELHLFKGGYAGIVLQEDRSVNICLAVRKSRLAESGGNPQDLLADLIAEYPQFAMRLSEADTASPVDAIAAVPYGWICRDTRQGLFRLGDQAAVIPSLAGEGMSIALASATAAADAWIHGGAAAAPKFQSAFAARVFRPVQVAGLIRRTAEQGLGMRAMTGLTRHFGVAARLAMRLSRISS